MTNYYTTYAIRYMEADENTRRQALKHWNDMHIENVKSGRDDMIIFSSKILTAIHAAQMALQGDPRLIREMMMKDEEA